MKKTTFITAALMFAASLFLTSCDPTTTETGKVATPEIMEGVWTLTKVYINDEGDIFEFDFDYTKQTDLITASYLDLPGIITLKHFGNDKYAFNLFVYDVESNVWYKGDFGDEIIIKNNKFMEEGYEEYFLSITNLTANSFTLEEKDESFSLALSFKKLSGNPDDVDNFIEYEEFTDDDPEYVKNIFSSLK